MKTEDGKICPLLLIGAAIRSSHQTAEMPESACVCVGDDCEMWRFFGEEGYCGLAGDINRIRRSRKA